MIQNQDFTYIGKNSNLTGSFKFKGTTHLKGFILGDIVVENGAKLILEIESITEGSLLCNDLDIYGKFTGNIKSEGRVTIYPTAQFEGKIITRSLEILPGAIVNMIGHTEE